MAAHTEFTAISLCTGLGMFDHAINAALAGAFRSVLMVEREAFCVADLVAQMEQGFISQAHIWSDVETVTCAALRRIICARLGSKRLDFVIGGIPCQAWSVAGKQLGKDDERDLWPATLRAIEVYQPRFVFIENVDGIAGKIDGARRILCDLEQAGYFAKAGLFSSKEIGGAHIRKRWFFLGIAKSEQQQRQWECADGRESAIGRSSNGMADDPFIRKRESHNERFTVARQDARRDISGSSLRLADSIGARLQGRQFGENGKGKLFIGESSLEFPRYAPTRNDFDAWVLVAEINPALLPTLSTLAIRRIAERNVNGRFACNLEARSAGEDLQAAVECEFRRLADEYSARDHKLRAIGNSVDWRVAAYAFVTLWSCMEHELRGEKVYEHGQVELF